ncbi:hypothetical protein M0R36_04040 [bacterium]|jgi:hypothetical protein|nr:hypothetical protein [bacterium]
MEKISFEKAEEKVDQICKILKDFFSEETYTTIKKDLNGEHFINIHLDRIKKRRVFMSINMNGDLGVHIAKKTHHTEHKKFLLKLRENGFKVYKQPPPSTVKNDYIRWDIPIEELKLLIKLLYEYWADVRGFKKRKTPPRCFQKAKHLLHNIREWGTKIMRLREKYES